jgi:hypothetical protein
MNHKCINTRVSQLLSPKRTNHGNGEEREEILLELSNRSLELALSLEWSTNPWEWERRRGELFFSWSSSREQEWGMDWGGRKEGVKPDLILCQPLIRPLQQPNLARNSSAGRK